MSDSTASTSSDVAEDGNSLRLDGTEKVAQATAWSQFQWARASLAEAMDDDELRDLGFDLDVLDDRP